MATALSAEPITLAGEPAVGTDVSNNSWPQRRPAVTPRFAFLLGLLTACGGDDAQRLFRIVVIERGDICPSGGSLIFSGEDHNGNGVLDDDEIDLEQTRCSNHAP